MNYDNLNAKLSSAQITADAYEEVVPLFVMVENENRAGGTIFHRRKCSTWSPDTGPYLQIASVLPYSYDPKRAN